MANLKEVRTRIASAGSMQQITNAMKMVSASKLRKAQVAVQSSRPYAEKIVGLLKNINFNIEEENIYAQKRPLENILIVAIASNKGLCGAFNSNITKETKNRIQEYLKQDKFLKIHLLTVGSRISKVFKAENYPYLTSQDGLLDNMDVENTFELANSLINSFLKPKYDRIEFIYNKFKNAATQIITVENFLPIEPQVANQNSHSKSVDYIFEPSKDEIIEKLTYLALQTQTYQVFLNSVAAEHGARMITMQKASDNANELLKELKLSYNKARQSAITNEIIEIVSGAQVLK